ncbi:DctP family TRAP transporter solute-binding subunit [Massilia oculi]|uniref:DctP family TRAP transporter solute-binding subunit n=1 Tax=Massilia hydrophila TaxID=3044279 RepID=A0ABS7Y7C1_9BURK|nr:DctP family TRAP transporter solute-binding subunit [Massilia oculi]MCA1855578.1 DctP family TRAP transporter solute-binding subunit [Massilia oculi]
MLVTLLAHFATSARRARSLLAARPACQFSCMLACLLACLPAPAFAAAQDAPGTAAVRELDIADYRAYLAEDHPARMGMRRFAQLVEQGSAGTLRLRVRGDAVPGAPGRQIAAVAAAEANAPALMLVAASGLAGLAPAFSLLDLPFLLRDADHADAVLDGPFGDALLARLAQVDARQDAGLIGLAWWENGFRHITSAGAPLRGAAALRGLTLRVPDEPVFVEGARAMGADPLPLPFGALYGALQSGRAAAQDNFLSQILAGRLYEVQQSLTLTDHSYGALVLVVNRAAWRALAPDQQAVLGAAAREAGRHQRAVARAQAGQALAELARHGLAVHTLAPSERARLRQATAPLRDIHFSRHGDDLRRRFEEQGALP